MFATEEISSGLQFAELLPRCVETSVLSRWGWPAVTLALTSLYLVSAALELDDFQTAVKVQKDAGLKPSSLWAAGTMAVQVIGSVAIVSGRAVWLGAGLLGA